MECRGEKTPCRLSLGLLFADDIVLLVDRPTSLQRAATDCIRLLWPYTLTLWVLIVDFFFFFMVCTCFVRIPVIARTKKETLNALLEIESKRKTVTEGIDITSPIRLGPRAQK